MQLQEKKKKTKKAKKEEEEDADEEEEYISLEKSVGDRYDMDAWHDGNKLVTAIVAKKKFSKNSRSNKWSWSN